MSQFEVDCLMKSRKLKNEGHMRSLMRLDFVLDRLKEDHPSLRRPDEEWEMLNVEIETIHSQD